MSTITVQAHQMLERVLSLEIVRVTERAAVSAARLRGHGNEKAPTRRRSTQCGAS
jgi:fructose-1,6-bisphosphatase II / sedoheptulose-1,7-bisphosphatase